MIFSHLIYHVFLINLRINFFKKIFHNFKIKESRIGIIFPKANNKYLKTQNKSNIHINKKRE